MEKVIEAIILDFMEEGHDILSLRWSMTQLDIKAIDGGRYSVMRKGQDMDGCIYGLKESDWYEPIHTCMWISVIKSLKEQFLVESTTS